MPLGSLSQEHCSPPHFFCYAPGGNNQEKSKLLAQHEKIFGRANSFQTGDLYSNAKLRKRCLQETGVQSTMSFRRLK